VRRQRAALLSVRKLLLTILFALFVLRVLGQLGVVLFAPPWLPPMEAWYSGLLSYPLLLPSQIIIIGLMIWMIRRPPPVRRMPIVVFATIYAVGMIVRYAILRTHEIPVVFHLVLATFLFVYALVPPAEAAMALT
jgi:hypothetical protein